MDLGWLNVSIIGLTGQWDSMEWYGCYVINKISGLVVACKS